MKSLGFFYQREGKSHENWNTKVHSVLSNLEFMIFPLLSLVSLWEENCENAFFFFFLDWTSSVPSDGWLCMKKSLKIVSFHFIFFIDTLQSKIDCLISRVWFTRSKKRIKQWNFPDYLGNEFWTEIIVTFFIENICLQYHFIRRFVNKILNFWWFWLIN